MNSPKSVLLVEDNEFDQLFFIKALSQIENATLYDVANNGKEALDKLSHSDVYPDLIFMDINMPEMDGIECLYEIIKNPKTRDIPVVIISTSTDQMKLVQKLGAKAFLEKPWDYKVRQEQIEQMIHLDFIADSQIANRTFQTAHSAF